MKPLIFSLAAVVLATGPALAQTVDCDNIPTMVMTLAEPPEYAACRSADALPEEDVDPRLFARLFGGERSFGINFFGNRSFVSFSITNPSVVTPIAAASNSDNFYAGDFRGDDFTQVFATLSIPGGSADLYSINPTTGDRTLIGSTGLPSESNPTAMTWDYTTSTMYLVAAGLSGQTVVTSLYTLDLTTGAATLVAPVTAPGFVVAPDLLAHPTTGVLYAVEENLDYLFSIDKTTGVATPIGPIGINISFPQDGDFDNATGTAYLCAFEEFGRPSSLRTVDLTTGLSTSVGSLGMKIIDICAIGTALNAPPTGPGLVASPGTVNFGDATTVGTPNVKTITLTNNGTEATMITSITSSGAPFAVDQTGTAFTLAPGASTTFTVTFTPTNTTPARGTITVVSNAPDSPNIVTLLGTGNADLTSTIPPGTTIGGAVWARPFDVGTGASGGCTVVTGTSGSAVSYRTVPFSTTAAGNYTITTNYSGNTPPYDGFILLYRDSFNPSDPCLNLLALDDDYTPGAPVPGPEGSQITRPFIPLLAAGQYVLVVTGFGNTDAGTFTGTIVGPGAASFSVASEDPAEDTRTFLSLAPNPASAATHVRFATATRQDVTVAVYDLMGRHVATLFQGAIAADQSVEATLDTTALAAGLYVVRMTGAALSLGQRLAVVR